MAFELIVGLAPDAAALSLAVAVDLAVGDPVYRGHPVRIMGWTLQRIEAALWAVGANGYGGGVALFLVLAALWTGGVSLLVLAGGGASPWLAWTLHVYLLYSLIAMGDLLHHGWRIERALRQDDLEKARRAVSQLVGRDTDRMDHAACRRAAVESLSENLTDGFVSPLCWYIAAGLPGVVLFKVVSTMDSMVGYKTERYIRFGWCGARIDDLMNLVPARLTFVLLSLTAALLPQCSGRKAWRVGLDQHAVLPGPNSGWSEAATAGALERRLIGPIRMHGQLVTDVWLGDPTDPPLGTAGDYRRASALVAIGGLVAALIGWLLLLRWV